MEMEKILETPINIGRKTISYIANDPFGETLFATSYYGWEKDAPLGFIVPLALFSGWHICFTIGVRKRLNNKIKEKNGLNGEIIEELNYHSWCAHWATKMGIWGRGEYNNFKDILNKYSYRHYKEKLISTINDWAASVSSLYKDSSLL